MKALAAASGRSMSAVVRQLIDGAELRQIPPADYLEMTRQLNAIGNNLNQLTRIANASGQPPGNEFDLLAAHLRQSILAIRQAVEAR